MDYRIISLGTLDAHPLWDERVAVRTGHATTVLVTSGNANVLVNPSLPPQALLARMSERTPLKPDDITHVFLTSFEPDHRRALTAFDGARWLLHEPEKDAAAAAIKQQRDEAMLGSDDELVQRADREMDLLRRCEVAPDTIAPKVDLFPLPGVTPGTCGLLLSLPRLTVLICGDAVPTIEHLTQGKVLPHVADIERAQESFREAIEIADLLILGRDNMALNPLRRL